jgi:hypothetical protein
MFPQHDTVFDSRGHMSRVFIPLCQDEKEALLKLAKIELRQPVEQAHFILRQELTRLGYLQADPAQLARPVDYSEHLKRSKDLCSNELGDMSRGHCGNV